MQFEEELLLGPWSSLGPRLDPKSQTPLKEMGISGELITVIKQVFKPNCTFLPDFVASMATEAIDSELVCQYNSWTNAINPTTTPSNKERPCETAERTSD